MPLLGREAEAVGSPAAVVVIMWSLFFSYLSGVLNLYRESLPHAEWFVDLAQVDPGAGKGLRPGWESRGESKHTTQQQQQQQRRH